MAARLHSPVLRPPEIVDLRQLAARDLEPLLAEETAAWLEELHWDFEKSADLVRRFVDLRALNGCALIEDGEVTGYLYYVIEDNKGLIGDLFVRRAWSSPEREAELLEWGVDAVMKTRPVNRIESQLMMLRHAPGFVIPRTDCASTYRRNFMYLDLERAALAEGRVRQPMYIEKWSDHYQEPAAQLIAAAYTGHVDSRVNDQYRSIPGARRFLYNIVQYPGCGSFYRPASFAAFEAATGRLCGISLASLVAPACGHITQICVSPVVRGTGIGYALLRQSLTTLRDMGCRSATLTVTSSNTGAVNLYLRTGFEIRRQFSAYVWERW
ncbi:MAG TPA: GNAT family N-acetyltransferase [Bryobacteraceae bacterium]|jgi:ribosomal protein S18 acetylase RimI-like enzyme|nr:GNAT family N-acetyltransferase [Bryobacteraceae bacterium]